MTIYEKAGTARFVDPHTIEAEGGLRLQADKIILCGGGTSRRLQVPGFELTATHSDAWSLTSVPSSMLVIGGGATGVQVASIFNAFGSRIQLFRGLQIRVDSHETTRINLDACRRQIQPFGGGHPAHRNHLDGEHARIPLGSFKLG